MMPSKEHSMKYATAARKLAAIAVMMVASCADDSSLIVTSVYMVNTSREDVTVQVFGFNAPLDCTSLPEDPVNTIDPALFKFEGCHQATPFRAISLERWRMQPSGVRQPPACDAVVLRAAGMEDTLLVWNGLRQREVNVEVWGNELDPHAVYLEQLGDRLFVAPGLVKGWVVSWPIAHQECGGTP